MRILHLTSEFPPVIWGGLGTAVGGLVNASASAGLEIGVLLVGGILSATGSYFGWRPVPADFLPTGLGETTITPSGITFFHVDPADGIEAGLIFARRWRPDIIHLHSAWLWHVADAIRTDCGTPVVFTVHSLDRAEYEIGGLPTLWHPQENVIASADRVIAISRSEQTILADYCPAAAPRVRVVGNGIEDDGSTAIRSPTAGPDSPVVLFSGRFVDRKGIWELFEAIPRILAVQPQTRFVLVGGYGCAEEVRCKWLQGPMAEHAERIVFTGWLPPDAVTRHYQAADILVIPSWYEPFGMVVLEGMLHGLALAAADVGGPAEILKHGETALLFPPRDVDALCASLTRLVRDPALRGRLGRNAAATVRTKWLWPVQIARMKRVYQEVLPRRSSAN